MTKSFHILFFALTVILFGCETVVDVKTPAYQPSLVPQALFTEGNRWIVQLSSTASFTSAAAPVYVDNAIVEIWNGETMIERLVRSDSGLYVSNLSQPVAGDVYTLKAMASGFAITQGTDSLPSPLSITSLDAINKDPDPNNSSLRRQIDVTLNLKDEAEKKNYYGLFVIQARLREDRLTQTWTPFPPSVFIFESNDPSFEESEFNILNDEANQYIEAFFTDDLFNGLDHSINLSFSYDTSDPQSDIQMHRAFAIVLLSVSEDFFLHWKTASRQAFTNENPFSEPLRVHSNMTGGLGIFAGFRFGIYPVAADTLALDNVCNQSPQVKALCDSLLSTSVQQFL